MPTTHASRLVEQIRSFLEAKGQVTLEQDSCLRGLCAAWEVPMPGGAVEGTDHAGESAIPPSNDGSKPSNKEARENEVSIVYAHRLYISSMTSSKGVVREVGRFAALEEALAGVPSAALSASAQQASRRRLQPVQQRTRRNIFCTWCMDDPSIEICALCGCKKCLGKFFDDSNPPFLCRLCGLMYHSECLPAQQAQLLPASEASAVPLWTCQVCEQQTKPTSSSAVISAVRGRPKRVSLPPPTKKRKSSSSSDEEEEEDEEEDEDGDDDEDDNDDGDAQSDNNGYSYSASGQPSSSKSRSHKKQVGRPVGRPPSLGGRGSVIINTGGVGMVAGRGRGRPPGTNKHRVANGRESGRLDDYQLSAGDNLIGGGTVVEDLIPSVEVAVKIAGNMGTRHLSTKEKKLLHQVLEWAPIDDLKAIMGALRVEQERVYQKILEEDPNFLSPLKQTEDSESSQNVLLAGSLDHIMSNAGDGLSYHSEDAGMGDEKGGSKSKTKKRPKRPKAPKTSRPLRVRKGVSKGGKKSQNSLATDEDQLSSSLQLDELMHVQPLDEGSSDDPFFSDVVDLSDPYMAVGALGEQTYGGHEAEVQASFHDSSATELQTMSLTGAEEHAAPAIELPN